MDTRRAARHVSGGRQGEGHQRAVSSLAGGGHLTAVRAGQVGRDREADTAAGDTCRVLAAEEPVEDVRQLVGGDAGSGVGDLQYRARAGLAWCGP